MTRAILPLFEAAALARRTDPETSHLGAQHAVKHLGEWRQRAYQIVLEYPHRTATELAHLAGIADPRHINRRLGELERDGLLLRGIARKCEHTGRQAHTWSVT